MALDVTPRRKRVERLEDRFEFQGDGVTASDGQALRSALFRVVERRTGAERVLRVWRKTGSAADRDLLPPTLGKHERRQVQRLMSSAGAAELVVNVLAFVEDEAEFGGVLEDAGIPFSRLRERAGRHRTGSATLGVTAELDRALWRNLARVAQALGLLHVHRE